MASMFDAVVLAAGAGTRFAASGGETYKQLVPFQGVPLIVRIVDILLANPEIENVIVVTGEDETCATAIRQALTGHEVSYVRNDVSRTDNNLVSFWKGVEHSGNGVVVVEADCVFDADDLTALLQGTGVDHICWANIGDLAPHRSGGVVSIDADGRVDGLMILDAAQMESFKAAGRKGLKMYGLTVMGVDALRAYREKIRAAGLRPHQYFHAVAMESFGEFQHSTIGMSPAAFSFNTVEEYLG